MSKSLVIIPAYNEDMNIEKVLNELKNDFSETDVLVINDCSKDKTKEVVERNNVMCITLPFNMGYSRAIQTGIKYANYYDYDYVIQFDADGQHIAKEAEKLYLMANEPDLEKLVQSSFQNL